MVTNFESESHKLKIIIYLSLIPILEGCGSTENSTDSKTYSASNELRQTPSVASNTNLKKKIQCVPGCDLDEDTLGLPIVPNWCQEWVSKFETVCRESQNKSECATQFERSGQSDSYVCQRIDITVFQNEKSQEYWDQLFTSTSNTDIFNQDLYGKKCKCELETEYNQRYFISNEPKNWDDSLRSWCATVSDGYNRFTQVPRVTIGNNRLVAEGRWPPETARTYCTELIGKIEVQ